MIPSRIWIALRNVYGIGCVSLAVYLAMGRQPCRMQADLQIATHDHLYSCDLDFCMGPVPPIATTLGLKGLMTRRKTTNGLTS